MGPMVLVTMRKGRSYCSALITPSICHLHVITFVCLTSQFVGPCSLQFVSALSLRRALTKDYEYDLFAVENPVMKEYLTTGEQATVQRTHRAYHTFHRALFSYSSTYTNSTEFPDNGLKCLVVSEFGEFSIYTRIRFSTYASYRTITVLVYEQFSFLCISCTFQECVLLSLNNMVSTTQN